MNLGNLKIGVRLGVGYGVVMLLLAVLVAVALNRLTSIGAINEQIIQKEVSVSSAPSVDNGSTSAF